MSLCVQFVQNYKTTIKLESGFSDKMWSIRSKSKLQNDNENWKVDSQTRCGQIVQSQNYKSTMTTGKWILTQDVSLCSIRSKLQIDNENWKVDSLTRCGQFVQSQNYKSTMKTGKWILRQDVSLCVQFVQSQNYKNDNEDLINQLSKYTMKIYDN